MKIKELEVDKTGILVCLVKEVQECMTRTNKPYVVVTLSDVDKTEIKAKMWDTTKADFEAIDSRLIYCSIAVSMYNGNLNYVVKQFREATEDEANIADFIKSAPLSGNKMYSDIFNFAQKFEDQDYGRLICNILQNNKEHMLYWSAAKAIHHNMIGGLLYHTYRMLETACNLSDIYSFNRELLYTGVILHDIGKLVELNTNQEGIAEYSVEGSLLGHSLLGCDMILQYGDKLSLPKEKIMVLRHMLAAHHGKLEWGAIQEPMIPEAFLLNYLDIIDSKMFQLEALDISPGTLSEKIFGLENKRIYQPLFS